MNIHSKIKINLQRYAEATKFGIHPICISHGVSPGVIQYLTTRHKHPTSSPAFIKLRSVLGVNNTYLNADTSEPCDLSKFQPTTKDVSTAAKLVGAKLKAARIANGVPGSVGVSRTTLQELEEGKDATITGLYRIAEFYGLSLGYLLDSSIPAPRDTSNYLVQLKLAHEASPYTAESLEDALASILRVGHPTVAYSLRYNLEYFTQFTKELSDAFGYSNIFKDDIKGTTNYNFWTNLINLSKAGGYHTFLPRAYSEGTFTREHVAKILGVTVEKMESGIIKVPLVILTKKIADQLKSISTNFYVKAMLARVGMGSEGGQALPKALLQVIAEMHGVSYEEFIGGKPDLVMLPSAAVPRRALTIVRKITARSEEFKAFFGDGNPVTVVADITSDIAYILLFARTTGVNISYLTNERDITKLEQYLPTCGKIVIESSYQHRKRIAAIVAALPKATTKKLNISRERLDGIMGARLSMTHFELESLAKVAGLEVEVLLPTLA